MRTLLSVVLSLAALGGLGKAFGQAPQSSPKEWDETRDFVLLYKGSPVPLLSFLDQKNSYRSPLIRPGIKWDYNFKDIYRGTMSKFVAVTVEDGIVRVWHSASSEPDAPRWRYAGDFDERRIKGPWWKRTLKATARYALMVASGGHMAEGILPLPKTHVHSEIHYEEH